MCPPYLQKIKTYIFAVVHNDEILLKLEMLTKEDVDKNVKMKTL